MANLSRSGRIPTRRHRADVHHMDESRAPSHQFALKVDGRNHVDIRLMNRREIGIIEQKNIVGVDALVFLESLDTPFGLKNGGRTTAASSASGGSEVTVNHRPRA